MSLLFIDKQGQAKYLPSTQSKIDLSTNYHLQTLHCKLEVTHTNGATPVFKSGDILALINSIQIVVNGGDNIKSVPAEKFYLNSIVNNKRVGIKDIKVTADTADLKSYVHFAIDFSMPRVKRPHDTILNTAKFQQFTMLINWGSNSTIGTGITVTDATLTVDNDHLIGYKRNKLETISYYKEQSLVEDINSTTTAKEITLPVHHEYRSFMLVQKSDGLRVENIVKRVTLKSGSTIFLDMDFDDLRAMNDRDYKPDSTDLLQGVAILDFSRRGHLSDMLNTLTDYNTLELILDVEKQTEKDTITVYSDIVLRTDLVEVK